MSNSEKIGLAMAVAVTQLLGCAANNAATEAASAADHAGAATQGATTDLIHCYGVNQCKGHNDCKTAENSCAGHAECKGHGFVGMSEKSCNDIGGELKDDYRGEQASADLIHCHGVNQCKGHNDCKTAENSCAGHSACKGHGFLGMSAKACEDVGGRIES